MTKPLPVIDISGNRSSRTFWSSFHGELRIAQPAADDEVRIRLERCALGRLRNAYPVSAADIEIIVHTAVAGTLPSVLREIATTVFAQDEDCRRVVYATPRVTDQSQGPRPEVSAALEAGFRFGVDVDLESEELSLFVAEPEWVVKGDTQLDTVPGT